MNVECRDCFAWYERDNEELCPLCGASSPAREYTPRWVVDPDFGEGVA